VITFLENNKAYDNLFWGYNSGFISDNDSTTNVLFALNLYNKLDESCCISFLSGQKVDGSFPTYNDSVLFEKHLNFIAQDFKGWTSSHICVSALIFYFLSSHKVYPEHKDKLIKYLLSTRNEIGLWESYWWTSPIYSTCFVIKGLINENDEKYDSLITNSLESLIKLANPNHSFGSDKDQESAFFTFLVLDTICSSTKTFKNFRQTVENILGWVLSNQFDDGSFDSSYILRIPSPEVTSNQSIKIRAVESISGLNIVRDDKMRLFTSVVGFNALSKYLVRNK